MTEVLIGGLKYIFKPTKLLTSNHLSLEVVYP